MSDTTNPDPKSTPGYRFALGAVIFLGFLILVGIAMLAVGFVKGWGSHPEEAQPVKALPAKSAAAPAANPVSMTLAPGFHILSADTQPGRLILHIRSATKEEVDIIDLTDGRIVSQIHAQAPAAGDATVSSAAVPTPRPKRKGRGR